MGFVTGDLENSILKQDKPAGSDPTYKPLDLPIQRKFDKQLDQLGKVFEKRIKVDNNPRIKISGRFHFDILDRVLCRRSAIACEWERAGHGLMLGAWHPRRQESLGKRLLQPAGNTEMILRAVTDAAAKILDPQLQDNCLFVGNLGSHETGFPITPWGGIPMLWWPLRKQQIHDLIFGHVMVVTLFNPAQLWEILRKRGFEVILGQRSRVLKLTKKMGRKRLDVKNFSYFENLTSYALMDENAVADMIDAWVEQAAVAVGDRSAKIFMRPHLISTFVKAPTSIP